MAHIINTQIAWPCVSHLTHENSSDRAPFLAVFLRSVSLLQAALISVVPMKIAVGRRAAYIVPITKIQYFAGFMITWVGAALTMTRLIRHVLAHAVCVYCRYVI